MAIFLYNVHALIFLRPLWLPIDTSSVAWEVEKSADRARRAPGRGARGQALHHDSPGKVRAAREDQVRRQALLPRLDTLQEHLSRPLGYPGASWDSLDNPGTPWDNPWHPGTSWTVMDSVHSGLMMVYVLYLQCRAGKRSWSFVKRSRSIYFSDLDLDLRSLFGVLILIWSFTKLI